MGIEECMKNVGPQTYIVSGVGGVQFHYDDTSTLESLPGEPAWATRQRALDMMRTRTILNDNSICGEDVLLRTIKYKR